MKRLQEIIDSQYQKPVRDDPIRTTGFFYEQEEISEEEINEFDEFMEEDGCEDYLNEIRQSIRKGMKKKDVDKIKADRIKEGKDWVTKNPMNHMNVVNAYLDTNDSEKEFGKTWYKDAHTLTKFLGKGSGHSTHVAAGIVANHSPQNGIYQNYHDATRVLDSGKGLGGKGSGVMASGRQRDVDDKIFADKSYTPHLKGRKISAFAHLLEHGGQTDPKNPRVVIDRHALSVLSGGRASDAAYAKAGLKGKKKYGDAEGHFIKAAEHLKEHHGMHVEPEHLQAATWAWRQRKNQEHEVTNGQIGGGKTYRQSVGTQRNWDAFAKKRFGHKTLPKVPGTGYAASRTKDDDDQDDMDKEYAKLNHPSEIARRKAEASHLNKIGFNDVEF